MIPTVRLVVADDLLGWSSWAAVFGSFHGSFHGSFPNRSTTLGGFRFVMTGYPQASSISDWDFPVHKKPSRVIQRAWGTPMEIPILLNSWLVNIIPIWCRLMTVFATSHDLHALGPPRSEEQRKKEGRPTKTDPRRRQWSGGTGWGFLVINSWFFYIFDRDLMRFWGFDEKNP